MWERWVIFVLSVALLVMLLDRQQPQQLLQLPTNIEHGSTKHTDLLLKYPTTAENNHRSNRERRKLSPIISSAPPSRQCSIEERDFQQNNFELTGLHICDKDLIWQLMHLALPDSRIFLDIGGNLGYTAARIFGLWSPGHQFNRVSLFQAISESIDKHTQLNLTTNLNQRTTFCRDGHFPDIPLVCIGQEQRPPERFIKPCLTRRSIEVYSFDGQQQHVENQRRIIYHYFPHLNPAYPKEFFNDSTTVNASWSYIHSALTNKILFKEGNRVGYFKVDDNEHGSLVQDPAVRDKMIADGLKQKHPEQVRFVEVPVTTIDVFVQEKGLKIVDIIKVDAEGSDTEVIQGGMDTILNKEVKVITFECSECLVREKYEPFFRLMDDNGFDCFLHGINQIVLKMTGNCWDYNKNFVKPSCKFFRKCPYYLHHKNDQRWTREAIDSNAYCIHRSRAAVLHSLVENLALYHYVKEEKRGHFLKDAFLSVDEVDFKYTQNLSDWSFRKSGKHKNLIWYHRMYGRDIRSGQKYDTIIPDMG